MYFEKSEEYECAGIIFDCPSGGQCTATASIEYSDILVVVMRITYQFRKGTFRYLDIFDKQKSVDKELVIVPNAVPGDRILIGGQPFDYDDVKEDIIYNLKENVVRRKVNFHMLEDGRFGVPEVPRFKIGEGILYNIENRTPEEEFAAKLSKALTELCEECVTGTANNSLLKNGIGRQRLMDNKYLIKLLDGAMKYAEADDSSEEYAPQFIETVIAALRYLQTGETDPIKQRDQKLSLKAIFPYVATYQFAKQTGDGYLINNFSIISAGGVDQNVQVLSEFEYRLNEKYYCLPHRKRSSSELNLWVEPVMIHYRGKTEERTE